MNHWILQWVKYINSSTCHIQSLRRCCPWLCNTHRHAAHCYRWVCALLWVGQCELKTTVISRSPSSVASACLCARPPCVLWHDSTVTVHWWQVTTPLDVFLCTGCSTYVVISKQLKGNPYSSVMYIVGDSTWVGLQRTVVLSGWCSMILPSPFSWRNPGPVSGPVH